MKINSSIFNLLIQTENLTAAKEKIGQLKSLIPMCSYCEKIRKNGDIWISLKQYTLESNKNITHGACPECAQKILNDLDQAVSVKKIV